jgi:uncharacterized membrane protein YphA (DoxX/SURF4 family)
MKPLEALVITPLRVALGALFVFAATQKLKDPQLFADSVKAFKVFDLDTQSHMVVLATFASPWLEAACGVLLILGLWTRAAGLALSALLLAFTIAIVSVLQRDLDVTCGCFGKYEWPCKGDVSLCQVARNAGLLLVSLLITWRGPGPLALDRLRLRRPVDSPPADA